MNTRVEEIFLRMKDQLKNEDHPITIIIRNFQKNFIKDYEIEIAKYLESPTIHLPEVSDSDEEDE
jgi:hypothetical protein